MRTVRTMIRRTVAVLTAAVVLVAGAGVAYAYWTADGSGTRRRSGLRGRRGLGWFDARRGGERVPGCRPHGLSDGLPATRDVRRTPARLTRLWCLVMIPLIGMFASGAAWAYWTATSAAGGNGASTAATVNAGATPTATSAGNVVTVGWAASTLSSGTAVAGYVVKRYDVATLTSQTILSACSGTVASLTCTETSVPTGDWRYSVTPVLGTNWVGAESAKSIAVTTDQAAPVNGITMAVVTGNAVMVGSTIYYRGTAAGSFTLTNALTDSGSGPASSSTATLTGTTTGWTHSPSTVSAPAGGPYVSTSFAWASSTTSTPAEVVTGRDVAGWTTPTTLSFVNDSTGPAGGSVDAAGLVGTGSRYSTSTTLSLVLDKGTDISGIAGSGATLSRATATLISSSGGTADGTCGTFGSYALITGGTDPVSPKSDSVADQACYSYQYVANDALGNATTSTSPAIKVDTTAPAAPTLAFSAFTNAYWSAGSTVYYRSAASTGSFTATATGTDAASGIATYGFAALGSNWTSTPGTLGVNVYSWSGAPAAPGAKTVTATNNATGTSATSSFTPTVDNTAPSAGTVTYADGTTSSTSVSVTFTTGTDGGSGLGTRLLQRATATLTAGACGAYGAYATVTGGTNPSSPLVDTVSAGHCHTYQYVVADNVSNLATATSASVVKVTSYYDQVQATAGLLSYWRLGEASAASAAADSKGTNPGTYNNSPTMSAAGAIAGDPDTAVQFNGSNTYVQAARGISVDFSIEVWFKSSQVFSQDFGLPHCTFWWQGAGLVDAQSGGTNDFGVSLCDGMVIGGVGKAGGDISIISAGGYNDNAWHHVVFTRTKATGVLLLYVDGVATPQVVGSTTTLSSSAVLNFGRSTGSTDYFLGDLDEIATYTVAVPSATVTEHYQAGR